MKRILLLFGISVCCSLCAMAQSMRMLWIEIPDSITPYLNRGLRTELADYVDMHVKSHTQNLLKGETILDSLTNEYLDVRLSPASRLQIRRLPYKGVADHNNDSILCAVTTLYGPEPESTVRFYNLEWKPVKTPVFNTPSIDELTLRPDSMTAERFAELRDMIDPMMVCAQLAPADNSLTVSLSMPLITNEDKQSLKAIILQRKYNWNGENFK
jgi:hypothetical protein